MVQGFCSGNGEGGSNVSDVVKEKVAELGDRQ